MRIDPDRLVRAYLGFRSPADDLFQTKTFVEDDSSRGILPGDREPDPYPASETPHGDQHAESQMPGAEPVPSTDSRSPVPSGEVREKERALPLAPGHPPDRNINVDRFVFNVPDARPDSRYREKTDVPVRTPGMPGEERGNPTKFDYSMPTRRPKEGGLFPKKRQRKQRGKAKRTSLKWYKRNRSRHKRRIMRRNRRLRMRSQVKRQKRLRVRSPKRFERRPGGGVRDPAQRSRTWREQKRQAETLDMVTREDGFPFLFGRDLQYAEIDGFDDHVVKFTVFPEFEGDDFEVMGAPETRQMDPMDFLGQAVFDDDEDLETVLDAIEDAYGPEVWDLEPHEIESPWMDEDAVVASSLWHTQFYEELAPDLVRTDDERKDEQDAANYDEDRMSGIPRGTPNVPTYPDAPDNWPSEMTRAPYRDDQPDDASPATPLNSLTPVEDSGGASKVIPWDSPTENRQDRTFRQADNISQILIRTTPKVKQRARGYTARITGHDKAKGMWFFRTGDYVQRMRAMPRAGKAQNVTKMDVLVSCSCPFWRWQGPEHWSKEHGYLYNRNRTRGTAAFPEIRDPKFRHGVCKHVVAVFSLVKSRKLKFSPKVACGSCDIEEVGAQEMTIPVESLRYLLDRSDEVEVESNLTAEALVSQYLGHPDLTNTGESP